MLSTIVLSTMTFAITPASAPVTPTLKAPTIINPLRAPGSIITVDILVDDVVNLWSVDLILSYDTSILTATAFSVNPVDPVGGFGFRNVWPTSEINDAAGYVRIGGDRGPSGTFTGELLGIGDGYTYTYYYKYPWVSSPKVYWNGTRVLTGQVWPGMTPGYMMYLSIRTSDGRIRFYETDPDFHDVHGFAPPLGTVVTGDYTHPGLTAPDPFPVASIMFKVEARGETVLDLHDTALQDIYKVTIDHTAIDGKFNNKFQGILAAPTYIDDALMPGDMFDIEVTVDDVKYLWGWQFQLSYDPNVIDVVSIVNARPDLWTGFYGGGGGGAVSTWGYAKSSWGITTDVPVATVRITFYVMNEGWTVLDLHDSVLADAYGNTLIHDPIDGGFSSVAIDVELKGRGAWPDVYKFKRSEQPDPINTLYARVASNTTVDVMVKVVFTVYDDELGIRLGTIQTAIQTLPALGEIIVTADFDTNDARWAATRYKVFIGSQPQVDITGDGVGDFFGSRIKPINMVVTP